MCTHLCMHLSERPGFGGRGGSGTAENDTSKEKRRARAQESEDSGVSGHKKYIVYSKLHQKPN